MVKVLSSALAAVCIIAKNEPLLDVFQHVLQVGQLVHEFSAIVVSQQHQEIVKPEIFSGLLKDKLMDTDSRVTSIC